MEHAQDRRLALIEVQERDGRVSRCVSVRHWPLSLGRALDNDVVIDDPFVAAHHAVLDTNEQGELLLTVGESINGVRLGGERHPAGAQVPVPHVGTTLQLGAVKLRLRMPGESLAAERLLPALASSQLAPPLLAGALLLLLALAEHWLTLDPGTDTTVWLPVALGLPLALAAWCGLWALVAKLFQHRFDFMGHLRIVLPWLLAIEVIGVVLPQIAAALGWSWLWRAQAPLQALLGLLLLRAHLNQLLPASGRGVNAVLATAALVGSAISLTLTQRATDRYSRPAYMSSLPLAGLNLTGTTDTSTLVQDLAPLAEQLVQRVKRARADEDRDGEASGD